MPEIRIAIAGVGNCASSLIQGIAYYAQKRSQGAADGIGLRHPDLGGYRVEDILPVAAFDIDARKIDRPLEEAIFALPNNTLEIAHPSATGVTVQMAPILDGVAPHLMQYPLHQRFEPAKKSPVDVAAALRESGAEILLNYLPVGSAESHGILRPGLPGSRRQPGQLHPRLHRLQPALGRSIHPGRHPLHRR